jgi:hypothetical protein
LEGKQRKIRGKEKKGFSFRESGLFKELRRFERKKTPPPPTNPMALSRPLLEEPRQAISPPRRRAVEE